MSDDRQQDAQLATVHAVLKDQLARITDSLAKYAPKTHVEVAATQASDFADMLRQAGLDVVDSKEGVSYSLAAKEQPDSGTILLEIEPRRVIRLAITLSRSGQVNVVSKE